MNVLIACEESQAVCMAFRELGHRAFSCDVQKCSGGHPEWHILGDCLPLLNGNCDFLLENGITEHQDGKWDLIIAHPPCTFLTVSGNRWFNVEKYGERALQRIKDREDAVDFFMHFVNADCDKIAIENPIGYMNTHYRKPNQTIQPWQFGHPVSKATCLWLKGLPNLIPTNIVEPDMSEIYEWIGADGRKRRDTKERANYPKKERAKLRAKTFPGIAAAMAEQWGK